MNFSQEQRVVFDQVLNAAVAECLSSPDIDPQEWKLHCDELFSQYGLQDEDKSKCFILVLFATEENLFDTWAEENDLSQPVKTTFSDILATFHSS